MAYELWDAETANILGSYPTEQAAALEIRDAVMQSGKVAVSHLALAFEDETGETRPIAAGPSLIRWAESTLAGTESVRVERQRRIA